MEMWVYLKGRSLQVWLNWQIKAFLLLFCEAVQLTELSLCWDFRRRSGSITQDQMVHKVQVSLT